MKKYESDQVESIEIFLSESKTPISYKAKKEELMESGMTEPEAERYIALTPFEMEVYYQKFCGLFLVESEATDFTPIYNPYTGEELEENES